MERYTKNRNLRFAEIGEVGTGMAMVGCGEEGENFWWWWRPVNWRR